MVFEEWRACRVRVFSLRPSVNPKAKNCLEPTTDTERKACYDEDDEVARANWDCVSDERPCRLVAHGHDVAAAERRAGAWTVILQAHRFSGE